jgi:peptidoglycan-N-acetylglucosamine deacetylase
MKMKLASVSLDLDNQWSYMKIAGRQDWQDYPSYFDVLVPYLLETLAELDLEITVFIVGKDAVFDKNKDYLREIAIKGHEVGNHSYHHDSWLHTFPRKDLEHDIIQAEEHIERATGQTPKGFRGPGFAWNAALLEILSERGYLYDASTFPTFLGPLLRLFYFYSTNLTREEKETRKNLFGSYKEGFRPVKPYIWDLPSDKSLIEIPVTTIPILKIPFHLTYLLYLHGYSPVLMHAYLNLALALCKTTGTPPSFLLHPTDLIGADKVPELSFFPGMEIPSHQKLSVFREIIEKLRGNYKVVKMGEFAGELSKTGQLKHHRP